MFVSKREYDLFITRLRPLANIYFSYYTTGRDSIFIPRGGMKNFYIGTYETPPFKSSLEEMLKEDIEKTVKNIVLNSSPMFSWDNRALSSLESGINYHLGVLLGEYQFSGKIQSYQIRVNIDKDYMAFGIRLTVYIDIQEDLWGKPLTFGTQMILD